MTQASALYVGRVTHHRLRPRRHSLAYRAYWLLLDLDEIDGIAARLRWFSRNRFNVFGFHDADHGTGQDSLRVQVARRLADAGLEADAGAIKLLTMPRLLGYVFNPLSVYFCYRRDGSLLAILYEVNNTFGERHTYVIGSGAPGGGPIQQRCGKELYVSPFLGMDMRYDFHVVPPMDRVSVTVRGSDASGDIIVANLNGVRAPLNDAQLLRVFVAHPLLTAKVTLGIHWEALLLWLKGLRIHPRPARPARPDRPIAAPDVSRRSA